jgi:hypothetical protein
MYFIDDKDLVSADTGFVFGVLNELFDVIDSSIRGSIHLDDIHVSAFIRHATVVTAVTRLRRGSLFAEQGFGKDSSGRSLSTTTESRKEVGMRESVPVQSQ